MFVYINVLNIQIERSIGYECIISEYAEKVEINQTQQAFPSTSSRLQRQEKWPLFPF